MDKHFYTNFIIRCTITITLQLTIWNTKYNCLILALSLGPTISAAFGASTRVVARISYIDYSVILYNIQLIVFKKHSSLVISRYKYIHPTTTAMIKTTGYNSASILFISTLFPWIFVTENTLRRIPQDCSWRQISSAQRNVTDTAWEGIKSTM